MQMHKERILKDDGRYLIFYTFTGGAAEAAPDDAPDRDFRNSENRFRNPDTPKRNPLEKNRNEARTDV